MRVPDSRSQTATVWSSDPETMRRPSGLTATELTDFLVSGELVDAGAGVEVPDRDGLVVGPGDDAPSVGAHRHGIHPTWWPVRMRMRAGDSLRVRQRSRRAGRASLVEPFLGFFGEGCCPNVTLERGFAGQTHSAHVSSPNRGAYGLRVGRFGATRRSFGECRRPPSP